MRVVVFIFVCIIRIQFIQSEDESTETPNITDSTTSTTSTTATIQPTTDPFADMLNTSNLLEEKLPDFLETQGQNLLVLVYNSTIDNNGSEAYYLYVNDQPKRSYSIKENEAVKFECPSQNSTSSRNDSRVTWVIFDNDTDIEIITELNVQNTTYQIVNATTDDDNSHYMCVMYTLYDETIRGARFTKLTVEQINKDPSSGEKNQSILDNPSSVAIIVLSIIVGFLLLGVCLFIRQRRNAAFSATIKRVIIERDGDSTDILKSPIVRIECRELRGKHGYAENLEYEFPIDDEWEFPRDKLKLTETVLGEGEFGQVIQAEAYGILQPLVWTTVAVKTLKAHHVDEDMASIVAEVEIMKMIGDHKHVLKLLGVSCKGNPFLMIMEYALHGNLKNFLKQCNSSLNYPIETDQGFVIDIKVLINFARQIAEGMEYLASLKCVHRDLAARNVLVCEDYVMKVADFGLARDIHYSEYYRNSSKGRLPVKWMAPESLLQRVYTSKSDSWSYGILLWEMMTLGGVPYPSLACCEELHQKLLKGYRMECPPNCPPKIYTLMRDCWMYNPNDRPDFQKIMQILDEILAENDGLDGMPFSGLSLHSSIDNLDTSSDEDGTNGNIAGDMMKKAQYPLLKERAAQLAKYPVQEEHVSEKTATILKNTKMRQSFTISEANEYTPS